MKTVKIFSVLSLALIFAAAGTVYAKKVEKPGAKSTLAASVTYQVVIHPEALSAPCNVYVVKVMDETGRMIAPAQTYKPGINKYTFVERVAAKNGELSRRVAILEPAKYPHHYVCANPWYAIPDVKTGPFLAGQTYFFNLFPRIQGQRGDE